MVCPPKRDCGTKMVKVSFIAAPFPALAALSFVLVALSYGHTCTTVLGLIRECHIFFLSYPLFGLSCTLSGLSCPFLGVFSCATIGLSGTIHPLGSQR